MRQKLVFIRMWPSPPIATSVERLLIDTFPEYQVETIDVIRLLKQRKDILLTNALATLREYGPGCLLDGAGRPSLERFKVVFFGTPFIFNRIKDLLAARLSENGVPLRSQIAFTFQLQSLFDASRPGIPHFVYTDHTMRENLTYPGFDPHKQYSAAWIELERTIYAHARRVFTRSSNITRSLVEAYGCLPGKVACVYAGSNARLLVGAPDNDGYRMAQECYNWARVGQALRGEIEQAVSNGGWGRESGNGRMAAPAPEGLAVGERS